MARRTSIRLPRRRWARRGRSLADFTVGFFLTTVAHLFLALIIACSYFVRQVGKVLQRRRPTGSRQVLSGAMSVCAPPAAVPSERTETERDAVEALVSLGMPRRVSERRVARIIDTHGALPIEELLREALAQDP